MTNNELIKLAEMSGFTPQYARNANFLFEKFAELLQRNSAPEGHVIVQIAKMQAQLISTQTALTSEYIKNIRLQLYNDSLYELLINSRDDIADKVYLNSQMLPYKQDRYDASVKQLADIDAMLAEIENNKL